MKHHAGPKFWQCYRSLPAPVRALADESYKLLKRDPKHPSLHFKKIGRYWSVRVAVNHRALAAEEQSDLSWFWIGLHTTCERS